MKRLNPLLSTLLFVVALITWQIPLGYPACPDDTPGYNCGPSEIDETVVLLLHFDPDHTDWDFLVDCSGSTYSPHGPDSNTSWGGIGGAPDINVDSAYFGVSGVSLDGNDSYIFSGEEEFQPRTGDFTFECWSKVPSGAGAAATALWGSVSNQEVFFGLEGGYMGIYNPVNGWKKSVVTDIRDDTWHHLVWARSGVTALLFVDGVKEAAIASLNDDIYSAGTRWGFGWNGQNDKWNGDVDEVRFTVGVCHWTENFAVPTEPY